MLFRRPSTCTPLLSKLAALPGQGAADFLIEPLFYGFKFWSSFHDPASEYSMGLNTVSESMNTSRFCPRFFIFPMALESLLNGRYKHADPLQNAIKLSQTLANICYATAEFPSFIIRVSGTKVLVGSTFSCVQQVSLLP